MEKKLIFTKTIENDRGLWNEKESSEQWYALECIGSLQETGALGPAPGVADEGSDEDAFGIEEFLGGSFKKYEMKIPVLPPATNAKPGPSQAPYDLMPQESDPTSQGSGEKKKLGKIPERPSVPKPAPPKAPEVVKRASQESEKEKKTEEDPDKVKVEPVSIPAASTVENTVWMEEGTQVLGFGHFMNYTYREIWNWICSGTLTMSGMFQGCNMIDAKVLRFIDWMHRLQQAIDARGTA